MSPDLTRIDHRHHFVADTHFGHVGILDKAMRPYSDIRAHDRDLVEQWNSLVQDGDTVWHLGDFAGDDVPFERAAEIFRKLNGTIHLIRGNHDGDEICSKLPWASVDIMRTILGSDGRKVVLCHYPLREWEGYHAGYKYDDFSDILANSQDVGANLDIWFESNMKLTIMNYSLSSLTAGNFDFT